MVHKWITLQGQDWVQEFEKETDINSLAFLFEYHY